tara:strand:+ start:363 stop:635 length:273 start_codon:yes stop_codon:yes gene_type:complete
LPLVVTQDSYQGRWNFLCYGDLVSKFTSKILMNYQTNDQTPEDKHTDIPLDRRLFDPKDPLDQQYIPVSKYMKHLKSLSDRYPLDGSDWK